LEVHRLTGRTLTEHFSSQKNGQDRSFHGECLKIGIDLEREALRRTIMERTREMFESGWPEEVEALLESGVDSSWYGMKSLGYPEVVAYVRGEAGREETIRAIAVRTGQYAKRQMTWFRKEKDVNWITTDGTSIIPQALKLLDSSGWNW
ncbi:MAG TPA: tRNA dimethylallyltransferase, partial [Candidatus Krumholzibacterium sp.]|nr:tRNA dimethylallyltransferase [Candidatus Krumholzibacterium sp.]